MWHLPTFGSNWTRATMEMVMNGTKRIEKQRESVRRMVGGMQVSFLKNQSGEKKRKKRIRNNQNKPGLWNTARHSRSVSHTGDTSEAHNHRHTRKYQTIQKWNERRLFGGNHRKVAAPISPLLSVWPSADTYFFVWLSCVQKGHWGCQSSYIQSWTGEPIWLFNWEEAGHLFAGGRRVRGMGGGEGSHTNHPHWKPPTHPTPLPLVGDYPAATAAVTPSHTQWSSRPRSS